MNSCVPFRRKIASNLLWTPQGVMRNRLVTLSAQGEVCAVEVCDAPDRQPFTEFYAGLLVTDFPDDVSGTFAWLKEQDKPLPELFPQLVRGTAVVVLSALDYTELRLTASSEIRKL